MSTGLVTGHTGEECFSQGKDVPAIRNGVVDHLLHPPLSIQYWNTNSNTVDPYLGE